MPETTEQPPTGKAARTRRIFAEDDYLPWVRAQQLTDCSLFWLPVQSFPVSHDEKLWLSEFLARFSQRMRADHDLRAEIFLQYKSLSGEMANEFLKYRRKCLTLMGLGRRPGATIPALPSGGQLREIVKKGDSFDINQWVGDYSYWFIMKQPDRQRELFLGCGGMTIILLPPDPKTKAPKLPFTPALRAAHPAFQKFDVDGLHEATYAMGDVFLEKSKQLFGAGLENHAQYDGLAFILPLLDSAHFFAATAEQRGQWFDLFHVYINESHADQGILLGFRGNYDALLLDVLESLSSDKLHYPRDRR